MLLILAEVTILLSKMPRNIASKKGRSMLLDTSVLIDGRIVAVASSGFVSDTLVIPRSVVGELQFLADNADAEKRSRARHGLDIVAELQEIPHIDVEILQDGTRAKEGVDNQLLSLAKKHGYALCTIDYNLNKVALVEGIQVLNVNELAQTLRMAHLPGEKIQLELTQKGQDSHQAVGHLPDGTMVVVEHANGRIGSTVEVEVIRSLQTAAGKMMFARLTDSTMPTKSTKTPRSSSDGRKDYKASVKNQNNNKTASTNNNSSNSNTKRNNHSTQKRRSAKQSLEDSLIDLVEKSHR